jgi:hypothetical protein
MTSLKHAIRNFLISDRGYHLAGQKIAKIFSYFSGYINSHRAEKLLAKKIQEDPNFYKVDEASVSNFLTDPVVRNGHFKGLRYPPIERLDGKYIRGPLLSKLLGCYEAELAPVLESVLATSYSYILTIGSAEGYYSIGLAMLKPEAMHYAYDTDPNARLVCEEIAKLNGVDERLVIGETCSKQTLASFQTKGRGLVICDCEGFELELFDTTIASKLKDCDFIIELHSFIDITIYSRVSSVFKDTHFETIVLSKGDSQKLREYNFRELVGLNEVTKQKFISEHRPPQEWLFLRSKTFAS